MDKKFVIQFIVLMIVIFAGLFSVFQPQLLGIPSIIPGGGIPAGMNTTTGTDALAVQQLLFIDQASTGNPELVKSILTVDVADTAEKRALGLSYRESMGQDQGMIFLFEAVDKYNFIMRGMKFPLDFIWVNNDQVVDILENIPPDPEGTPDSELRRYAPVAPVNKVIEVNAGYVQKHGIKVGDRIRMEALPAAQPSGTY